MIKRSGRKKKQKPQYSMPGSIGYTVRSVWRYQKFLFALLVAEVAMEVLIPLLGAYLPKLVIDVLSGGEGPGYIVLAIGGFTLVLAAAQFVGDYASTAKYMRYNDLRQVFIMKLYHKYLTCDYSQIESAAGQAKYQRALNATQNGDGAGISRMIPAVARLATGILGFILFSAVLSALHPLIAVLLTVTALANYGVMRGVRNYEHQTKDERAGVDRRLFYLARQADDLSAAKDIRLYRIKSLFFSLREGLLGRYTLWQNRVENRRLASYIFQAVTTLLRNALAFGYLFYAMLNGRIGASDAIFYFGAIAGFSAWVLQIVTQFNEISQAQLLLCDMRAYLEQEERPDPQPAAPLSGVAVPPEIRFEDVCFSYEGGGAPVIDHLSLHIAPGERVALVGLNGAGKTTIIKLLCGFYRPGSGRITIGGTDVAALKKSDLMTLFSAVFQNALVLPLTLAENITLCEKPEVDAARLEGCIARAGLEEIAARGGRGADSMMMKLSDEDGLVLSGGEVQKLLLARALYKDAPILVLDEPTAALDPIAESKVYDSYRGSTQGKTSLFISHRLASTRFCDRVVLLQNGRVAEMGTHDGLMAKNGQYAKLFELQSHYYREESAI